MEAKEKMNEIQNTQNREAKAINLKLDEIKGTATVENASQRL
jgi:low affinity Fe/Cu permease